VSIPDICPLSPFRGLNIGVFSALQSAAIDLERKLAAQNLKKDLKNRPQRETLVERKRLYKSSCRTPNWFIGNILPGSNVAPAIVGQQKELQKHMRADDLNEKLAHRPTAEELIKEGVLHEDPTSADELYRERIEDQYARCEGGA